METFTTEQQDPSMGMAAPKRPQFLNVICILSFIMCGIMFLMNIWGIVQNQPEKMQERVEQIREINPEMADNMEQAMIEQQENTYMRISPYLGFVYIALSFLGILMMFRLQKKGFYLYLAGELLPYLGFIFGGKASLSMGGAMGGAMETMVMVGIALMVIFDIAFIAMYGANLKHMKN